MSLRSWCFNPSEDLYLPLPQVFNFDYSFWSTCETDAHFASQEFVFEKVGQGALANAVKGYNACILAYGQTGLNNWITPAMLKAFLTPDTIT